MLQQSLPHYGSTFLKYKGVDDLVIGCQLLWAWLPNCLKLKFICLDCWKYLEILVRAEIDCSPDVGHCIPMLDASLPLIVYLLKLYMHTYVCIYGDNIFK